MIGYRTAVKIRMKRKNDHSFTRSASVPDTIEAVVATNTIWKNQSRHGGVTVADDRRGHRIITAQQCNLIPGRAVHKLEASRTSRLVRLRHT